MKGRGVGRFLHFGSLGKFCHFNSFKCRFTGVIHLSLKVFMLL